MLATIVPWFTGEKRHEYTFTVYEIGEDLPDASGLYIFAVPEGDGWRPVYIGETESLKTTLTDDLTSHEACDCILGEGVKHVHVLETGHTAPVRREMVEELMAVTRCVCNPAGNK